MNIPRPTHRRVPGDAENRSKERLHGASLPHARGREPALSPLELPAVRVPHPHEEDAFEREELEDESDGLERDDRFEDIPSIAAEAGLREIQEPQRAERIADTQPPQLGGQAGRPFKVVVLALVLAGTVLALLLGGALTVADRPRASAPAVSVEGPPIGTSHALLGRRESGLITQSKSQASAARLRHGARFASDRPAPRQVVGWRSSWRSQSGATAATSFKWEAASFEREFGFER
jgi:hypothetical protein